jgi:hypothetical protein
MQPFHIRGFGLIRKIILESADQDLALRLQYRKHRLPFALPLSAKHPLVAMKPYLCVLGTSVTMLTDPLARSSHSEREAASTAVGYSSVLLSSSLAASLITLISSSSLILETSVGD